jgi:hypothetical protein
MTINKKKATQRCSVVISEDLLSKVKQEAEQRNITASEMMRAAIHQHFENDLSTPPVKKSEYSAANKLILKDSFWHLRGKIIGDNTISLDEDWIKFHGEKGFHIIAVDAPDFEKKVRAYIKQLQGLNITL